MRRVVNNWIGVQGGYLGDFSYASHDDFWLETCEIDVDTRSSPWTTRECFIETLLGATARHQAAVLREILYRYPPPTEAERTDRVFRSPELHASILGWISRLELGADSVAVTLESPSEVVRRALDDAEVLMRDRGPQSAVDRVHTAMHGYLIAMCAEAGIPTEDRAATNKLLKLLLKGHPSFAVAGQRPQDIEQIVRGLAQIVDATNPVRNNSSGAHPNEHLIGAEEAWLVINAVKALLGYLESKRSAGTGRATATT